MQLIRFENPKDFYTLAEPFLMAHEAENCLLLGIARILVDSDRYSDPYMAMVEDADGIMGVVIRTPPFGPVISYMDSIGCIPLIVSDLNLVYDGNLPDIMGPKEAIAAFNEQWRSLAGQTAKPDMNMRIYRLEDVKPVTDVDGSMRRVSSDDLALAARWMRSFIADAHLNEPEGDFTERAQQMIDVDPELGGLYLWIVDGEPVSMAGYGGPTPNGTRIAWVYTPPELRRHGYASAVVAALSQHQLDAGRQFCFLFTDLSNPTSNSIYQKIGYEPVVDVDKYQLV